MRRREPRNQGFTSEMLQQRKVPYIDWERYRRIDAAELDPSRLRTVDQPREKLVDVDEMLRVSS